MEGILEIDGSVLEGGGQILRISISLSAILGVPVHITNIRAGRKSPGLAAQHLKGIELVGAMCQARVEGGRIGSTRVEFAPGPLRGGLYQAHIDTAGSVSLLMQVALPAALLAGGRTTLTLGGGTNAAMAPQVDYMGEVFRCMLRKFGGDFTLNVIRRGYYPRGGGRVKVTVAPVRRFKAATLTQRGTLIRVFGWSFVAGVLPVAVAHEMAEGAREELRAVVDERMIDIECYKEDKRMAPDNCSGIVVCGEFSGGCVLGADALGRRGAPARAVGQQPGRGLAALIRGPACVDQHAQDQLIIYMALAEGKSSVRVDEVTLHTKTAIYIAEMIAKAKFTIIPSGDGYIIECDGIGFLNKNLPADGIST